MKLFSNNFNLGKVQKELGHLNKTAQHVNRLKLQNMTRAATSPVAKKSRTRPINKHICAARLTAQNNNLAKIVYLRIPPTAFISCARVTECLFPIILVFNPAKTF